MKNHILTSYAVLKKLHEKQKDLLNAYIPFIEYAIYKINFDQIEVIEIQQFIALECNITIPLNTMKTILKKLVKQDLIEQINGYRFIQKLNINEDKIAEYQILFDDSERERNELINSFITYIGLKDVEKDNILRLFVDYIHESVDKIDIFCGIIEDDNISNPFYIHITEYINYIRENNKILYNSFQDIYYGTLLSKITDINEITEITRNVKELEILLDSNFIFRLLDYQNPYYNQSSKELFELLNNNGFKIRVLKRTIEEIRRVLNHRYSLIINNKIPAIVSEEDARYIDGIIGAIYRKKMTMPDLENDIKNIELKIEKLGISVDYIDVLSGIKINEDELKSYSKEKLLKYINFKKLDEYDVDVDVDEVIAKEKIPEHIQDMVLKKCDLDLRVKEYISKARKRDVYNFVDAKLIFLTCDKKLANYNFNFKNPHRINEIFLEESLTNILWLKNPDISNDIPLSLTLSVYKSSSFIDFKIFYKFNEYLDKIYKKDPSEIELIGDVFSNQVVLNRLRQIGYGNEGDDFSEKTFNSIIQLAKNTNKHKFKSLNDQLNELLEESKDSEIKLENAKIKNVEYESIINNQDDIIYNEKYNNLLFRFNIVPIIIIILLFVGFGRKCWDVFPFLVNNIENMKLFDAYPFIFPELIIIYLLTHLVISQKSLKQIISKYLYKRLLDELYG